jgi:hypothetical protein
LRNLERLRIDLLTVDRDGGLHARAGRQPAERRVTGVIGLHGCRRARSRQRDRLSLQYVRHLAANHANSDGTDGNVARRQRHAGHLSGIRHLTAGHRLRIRNRGNEQERRRKQSRLATGDW